MFWLREKYRVRLLVLGLNDDKNVNVELQVSGVDD